MTAAEIQIRSERSTAIGRVGWRRANWEEVLLEGNNDARFPPDTTYVLLYRTEHIEFVTKANAAANGLFSQSWSSGRLFNTGWELNWERQDTHYLLRLLTEGELPDGWQYKEFSTLRETAFLLFGQRLRDDDRSWREPRIPRRLEYPVPKAGKRVWLTAIPYLREGMVVRMRLKGVTSDGEASTEA